MVEHSMDEKGIIIKRREVTFTANDDALGFCDAMNSRTVPDDMKRWTISLLESWGLVSDVPDELNDPKFRNLIMQAKDKLKNKDFVLTDLPGYQEEYTARYNQQEIQANPIFLQLKEHLKESINFELFFLTSDFVEVIVRSDGRKQVLIREPIERTSEEIADDLKRLPEILPPFEIIELAEGEKVVLVDWIVGHHPETDEERNRCLSVAEPLKNLKVETGTGTWIENLDLNNSNFVITDNGNVLVIDRGIILGFINNGFKKDTET